MTPIPPSDLPPLIPPETFVPLPALFVANGPGSSKYKRAPPQTVGLTDVASGSEGFRAGPLSSTENVTVTVPTTGLYSIKYEAIFAGGTSNSIALNRNSILLSFSDKYYNGTNVGWNSLSHEFTASLIAGDQVGVVVTTDGSGVNGTDVKLSLVK